MLTARGRHILTIIACALLTVYLAGHTAMAKKNSLKPGVDKNFKWQRIGINEARKLGKPIFLYVYDPMGGKPSDPVKKAQQQIFANQGVQQALAPFTPVMQPNSATNWPPAYTMQAKNGVALYVMTCNARPVMTFTHRNMPKASKGKDGKNHYQVLEAAAAAAVKANPRVLEAMKKNPPKEYLSPQELAAKRAAKAEPEEPAVKEEKKTAAGLLDGPLGGKEKKGAARKKEPRKKPIPVDEDE